MNLGIIILAAGSASRMGKPKQILDIHGISLIERVVNTTSEVRAQSTTLVLGAHKEIIKPRIKHLNINIIENQNWAQGMSSSIKMGLVGTYMINKEVDHVLVMAGDMPAVKTQHLLRLKGAAQEVPQKSIFASQYHGSLGIPCLFTKEHFVELLNLEGDRGAAQIFRNNKNRILPIELSEGSEDLDTPEDYFSYLEKSQAK